MYGYFDTLADLDKTDLEGASRTALINKARTWAGKLVAPELVHRWLDLINVTHHVAPYAIGIAGGVAKLYIYEALSALPLTTGASPQSLVQQFEANAALGPQRSMKTVSLEWDSAAGPKTSSSATADVIVSPVRSSMTRLSTSTTHASWKSKVGEVLLIIYEK